MERISNFLSSCLLREVVDKATTSSGQFLVEKGDTFIKGSMGKTGFFLLKSAKTNDAEVVYTTEKEKVLCSRLATAILGRKDFVYGGTRYTNACVAPVRELDNALEFETASGKRFIVSTSNTRVTLGLYDILYANGAEHSIMMLPELFGPSPDVELIKTSLDILSRDYGVSLRNRFIASNMVSDSGVGLTTPEDIPARKLINGYLYKDAGRDLGRDVPDFGSLFLASSRAVVKLEKDEGYQVDFVAQNFGVDYHYSGVTKINPVLLSSAVSSVGATDYNLISGVNITDSPLKEDISKDIKQIRQGVSTQSTVSYKDKVLSGKEAQEELQKWTKNADYLKQTRLVILEV